MSILRFLGLGGPGPGRDAEPDSLTEMVATLDTMPEEAARLAAAFAYLLARVAGSDLRTDETEKNSMAERLTAFGEMDAAQAEVLAETLKKVRKLLMNLNAHLSILLMIVTLLLLPLDLVVVQELARLT